MVVLCRQDFYHLLYTVIQGYLGTLKACTTHHVLGASSGRQTAVLRWRADPVPTLANYPFSATSHFMPSPVCVPWPCLHNIISPSSLYCCCTVCLSVCLVLPSFLSFSVALSLARLPSFFAFELLSASPSIRFEKPVLCLLLNNP